MISYGMILFHEEDTNYNNNYINHIRYFDTVPSKKICPCHIDGHNYLM